MAKFSVEIPSSVKIPDLVQRVAVASLDADETAMMKRIFDAGRAYGALVRERNDDDAPTFGRIFRLQYEEFVNSVVPTNFQNGNMQLAFDLTAKAYNEGYRCHTEKPESLKHLIELLAE
ncbi:MAG: hypothetical protein AABX54_02105 [Nanoarchaeota archaeon]